MKGVFIIFQQGLEFINLIVGEATQDITRKRKEWKASHQPDRRDGL